mmetsp:Transcript_40366/g.106938  ORF Transcript_40366/g.106938 Transcript_40366/m.106938 type:complete len:217 (-) Transcript_40366:107-757(-)
MLGEDSHVGGAHGHLNFEVRRPRVHIKMQRGAATERDCLPNHNLIGNSDRIPIGLGVRLQVADVRLVRRNDDNLHPGVGVRPVDLLCVPVVPALLHREDARPLPFHCPRTALLIFRKARAVVLLLVHGFNILTGLRAKIVEPVFERVGRMLKHDGISSSRDDVDLEVSGPGVLIKLQRVCATRLQLAVGLNTGRGDPLRLGIRLGRRERFRRRVGQ